MKFMNKNKKGFTLVELMIVVVIMAILVAVAVPIFNTVTTNAKNKTCAANARTLSGQINAIILNEGVSEGSDGAITVLAIDELTNDSTIGNLIADSPNATDKIASFLQKKEIPECPFGGKYKVLTSGEVVCGMAGADGKHTTTPVTPDP